MTEESTLTPEQIGIAFQGPALGSNKFVATIGSIGVRLAFIEESPTGVPHFRTAVAMHPDDAGELVLLLKGLLERYQADMQKHLASLTRN